MNEYLRMVLFILSTALVVAGSNIQVNRRKGQKYRHGLNKKQIFICCQCYGNIRNYRNNKYKRDADRYVELAGTVEYLSGSDGSNGI